MLFNLRYKKIQEFIENIYYNNNVWDRPKKNI